MRSVGRFMGKMGSNKEVICGMMEGTDMRVIAEAINESLGSVDDITKYLDPKVVAEAANRSSGFMAEVIRYLDPKASAEIINKNERILPRFVEHMEPNVFTRSAGAVMTKLRYATYRPPQFGPPGGAAEQETPEE